MASNVELHDLTSGHLSEAVPYAVITPPGYDEAGPFPLCLVLMGGGGGRQSLVDCRPLFDSWWSDGSLPPMVLATPSAGMSYFLDDPDEGVLAQRVSQFLHWGGCKHRDSLTDRRRAVPGGVGKKMGYVRKKSG